MSWIKLVVLFLQIAKAIYNKAHDDQLVSLGEDRQVAKELTEMASRNRAIKEIETKFAQMPHEQVLKELEGDFRRE